MCRELFNEAFFWEERGGGNSGGVDDDSMCENEWASKRITGERECKSTHHLTKHAKMLRKINAKNIKNFSNPSSSLLSKESFFRRAFFFWLLETF